MFGVSGKLDAMWESCYRGSFMFQTLWSSHQGLWMPSWIQCFSFRSAVSWDIARFVELEQFWIDQFGQNEASRKRKRHACQRWHWRIKKVLEKPHVWNVDHITVSCFVQQKLLEIHTPKVTKSRRLCRHSFRPSRCSSRFFVWYVCFFVWPPW